MAANAVRKQLLDLNHKINPTLQSIFVRKKLWQDLKPREVKSPIVNRQCVVYPFKCDQCDANYVGYTVRHLHQRIAEHKTSAIGRQFLEAHVSKNLSKENQFKVLRKRLGKFDCFVLKCCSLEVSRLV